MVTVGVLPPSEERPVLEPALPGVPSEHEAGCTATGVALAAEGPALGVMGFAALLAAEAAVGLVKDEAGLGTADTGVGLRIGTEAPEAVLGPSFSSVTGSTLVLRAAATTSLLSPFVGVLVKFAGRGRTGAGWRREATSAHIGSCVSKTSGTTFPLISRGQLSSKGYL